MFDPLLQRSRYEMKYIISDACAREVRSYARHYLAPDPMADSSGHGGLPVYSIYSVYLDSPRLDLMRATMDGLRNRFKIRMRFYDARPQSPVFFEIKRRVNRAVVKERARVQREFAAGLLDDAWAGPQHLSSPGDSCGLAVLRRFCELRDKLAARPRVMVAYEREAWTSPDSNSARLTFDRHVAGGPYDPSLCVMPTGRWVKPPLAGTILELKFTDRVPNWMRDMVNLFGLSRCSLAKYVRCLQSMDKKGDAHLFPVLAR